MDNEHRAECSEDAAKSVPLNASEYGPLIAAFLIGAIKLISLCCLIAILGFDRYNPLHASGLEFITILLFWIGGGILPLLLLAVGPALLAGWQHARSVLGASALALAIWLIPMVALDCYWLIQQPLSRESRFLSSLDLLDRLVFQSLACALVAFFFIGRRPPAASADANAAATT